MKKQNPDSWVTIHFKDYPRLNRVLLPKNFSKSQIKLETAIKRRRSRKTFSTKELSKMELSKLLYYSCGVTRRNKNLNLTRRAYPSAGARYPLEVYIVILQKGEMKEGLYHYNVKKHYLEILILGNFKDTLKDSIVSKELADNAYLFLIITGIPSRASEKYPVINNKFVLLEAGHLAQNTYLIAETIGVGCCAIGYCDEGRMSKLLDIDLSYEKIIYLIAMGKK